MAFSMKAGVVKGLSIGYDTIQATYDGDIRHLTELKLWEISRVIFPMNESAQVSAVKALSDRSVLESLRK
jgi:HK97 family phage prohead protease